MKIALILLLLIPAFAQALPEIRDWGLALTQVPKASRITHAQNEVVVAVIDTGADITHPLLKGALWTNPGEIGRDKNGEDRSSNGIDDDGNGFIDDVHGWDFVAGKPLIRDRHGHGTHIAGIIRSVTTKAKVRLMILKYYDQSPRANTVQSTIEAIHYAIRMKADVINYSGGGLTRNPTEERAIRLASEKGILFVAAAGNESSNSDFRGYYPADYTLSNILSVAALNEDERLIEASNFGRHTVDIALPGKDILSSLPDGKYGKMTGTSQATAFASGLAALAKSQRPDISTPEQLISVLTKTASPIRSIAGKVRFARKLSAYRLLAIQDANRSVSGASSVNTQAMPESAFVPGSNPSSDFSPVPGFLKKWQDYWQTSRKRTLSATP